MTHHFFNLVATRTQKLEGVQKIFPGVYSATSHANDTSGHFEFLVFLRTSFHQVCAPWSPSFLISSL
jgi:hypothetical protein